MLITALKNTYLTDFFERIVGELRRSGPVDLTEPVFRSYNCTDSLQSPQLLAALGLMGEHRVNRYGMSRITFEWSSRLTEQAMCRLAGITSS